MSRFVRVGLPWASGIGKDVSDCTTSREVIEKVGLDWTVSKCELVAKMPFSVRGNNEINELNGDFVHDGDIFRTCPNAYATYRTDINEPLGLVKQKYEIVQNYDAFNFFDDAIGPGMAQWDRCGQFGYGHKIFISAKIPANISVGGDKIDSYLVFSNSHDGSSAVNILFAPIRVFCLNMLNSAIKSADSYIRIRHTQGVKNKVINGSAILASAIQHASDTEALYNSLYDFNMTDIEVMKYIANCNLTEEEKAFVSSYEGDIGYKRLFARDYQLLEDSKISTRKLNTITAQFEYYNDGFGQQQIAGTAWGAYNAITGYYSNVANLEKEKRVNSLLYGNANNIMSNALNDIVELKVA